MNRDTGHYWIKINDVWTIGFYDSIYCNWKIPNGMYNYTYKDNDINTIDENIIINPNI